MHDDKGEEVQLTYETIFLVESHRAVRKEAYEGLYVYEQYQHTIKTCGTLMPKFANCPVALSENFVPER